MPMIQELATPSDTGRLHPRRTGSTQVFGLPRKAKEAALDMRPVTFTLERTSKRMGRAMSPLAETWAQGTGAIVSSLADMTTSDRALYEGQELPPAQQSQLESLVSTATGKPIRTTTFRDPLGYGLGIAQLTTPSTGTIW